MLNQIIITILGFFLIAFSSSLFSEINSPIFKQIVCSVNVDNKNAKDKAVLDDALVRII